MRTFAPFGAVVAVKLCLKGSFGFVHFHDHAAAVAAICAMNGRPLGGKNIKAAWGRSPGLPAGSGGAPAAMQTLREPTLHPDLASQQPQAAAAAQAQAMQAMAARCLGMIGGAQGVLPALSQGFNQGFSQGMGARGALAGGGAALGAQAGAFTQQSFQQGFYRQQGFGGQQGYSGQQGFHGQPAYGGQAGIHPPTLPGFSSGLHHMGAGLKGMGLGGMGGGVGGLAGQPTGLGLGLGDQPGRQAGGVGAFAALHADKVRMGLSSSSGNATPGTNPGQGFSLAAAYGEIGQARALDAATRAAALGLLPNPGVLGGTPKANPAMPQMHAHGASVFWQKPHRFSN